MRAMAATGAVAILAQRAGQAAVNGLSHASPRLALTAAALAGYLGLTVPSDAMSLAELGTLLRDVPPSRLPAIRRTIYGHTTRTTLFFMLLARGELERLKPCLRVHGFERLHALVAKRAPAILLNWHTGPYRAVGTALYVNGFEPLVMEHHPIPHSVTVPLERVAAAGDTWTASAALKAAIDRLRGGRFVLMAGDGYEGARGVEAEVLGRRLVFRQGLATLVRLSGAPVLPTVASWRGGSIDVTVHPPLELPAGGDPEAVVGICARWLDGYLRAYPEELWPDRMRDMLAAPPSAHST